MIRRMKSGLRLADFSLKDVRIGFHQGFSIARSLTRNTEVEQLKAEINRLNMVVRSGEAMKG
ncbi:MAG: hypothetical protein R2758_08165 [Bacteroidales bacterium]